MSMINIWKKMQNYQLLCEKYDKLPKIAKEHIYFEAVGEKKLFLIRDNCPYLRPELKIHYNKRINKEYLDKINKLVIGNEDIRNFLFSNIQAFFNDKGENSKLVDPEDFNLFLVKEFILVNPTTREEAQTACFKLLIKYDDESIINEGKDFSEHIFRDIKNLNSTYVQDNDFSKKVISPFITLLNLFNLNKGEHYETDGTHYITIKPDLLTSERGIKLQNFFSCWIFHHFYEDYCNYVLEKAFRKEVIRNPKILINPSWDDRNKIIEGCIELDGSLIIEGDKIIISESKNSYSLTQNHLMILLGKTRLIENIYSISVECFLFSTGYRHNFMNGIEKYPKVCEYLTIKDRKDYKSR